MVAEASLAANSAVILVLIAHVMRLMSVALVLEALVHVHLVVLVSRAAIEQAMVLPVAAMVVHAVGIVRGRVRAG